MKIALCQLNPTIGDIKGNLRRIGHAIRRAQDQSASLILFPELALTGYPPKDLLLEPLFVHRLRSELHAFIRSVGKAYVILGTPYDPAWGRTSASLAPAASALRNSALTLHKGQIVHITHKTCLPSYDVFHEERYFKANPSFSLSNNLLRLKGTSVLITICEDIWSPRFRSFLKRLRKTGLSIDGLMNLSASPFDTHKLQERLRIARYVVKEANCSLYYVNQVGVNDDLIFDGRSFAMKATGDLTYALAAFKHDMTCLPHRAQKSPKMPATPPLSDRSQEIYQALVFGIQDTVRKLRFRRVAVALSGGVDSALVLTLAVHALGALNVIAVTMPSAYTSEESRHLAHKLSARLGMPLDTLRIDKHHTTLKKHLEANFKIPLKSTTDENLQARLRGLLIMAYCNQKEALLLATGNKSELAMGYATLYGDMNGALYPIGDLYKTDLYGLIQRVPALHRVMPPRMIEREPSAELRPNQHDQDDLPPYPILDRVLKAMIEGRASLEDVLRLHLPTVSSMSEKHRLIRMIYERYHKNEFKRFQSAPILRLSPKAFGSGRRYPLSKGSLL